MAGEIRMSGLKRGRTTALPTLPSLREVYPLPSQGSWVFARSRRRDDEVGIVFEGINKINGISRGVLSSCTAGVPPAEKRADPRRHRCVATLRGLNSTSFTPFPTGSHPWLLECRPLRGLRKGTQPNGRQSPTRETQMLPRRGSRLFSVLVPSSCTSFRLALTGRRSSPNQRNCGVQPRLRGAADSSATGVSPWTRSTTSNPEPPQGGARFHPGNQYQTNPVGPVSRMRRQGDEEFLDGTYGIHRMGIPSILL
jgi:hypothetical protein